MLLFSDLVIWYRMVDPKERMGNSEGLLPGGSMREPQTLLDLLALGQERSSRTAFVYRTGFRRFSFTYEESVRAALLVADALAGAGLQPSGRVLLWGPNSPTWAWAFFGILAAGGVVVPADMRATTETVRTIAQRARVSLVLRTRLKPDLDRLCPTLFLEDLFLAWMAERMGGTLVVGVGEHQGEGPPASLPGSSGRKRSERAGFPAEGGESERAPAASPARWAGRAAVSRQGGAQGGPVGFFPLHPVSPGDVAELLFTSGTTGDPKGVALTHRNILANIAALEQVIRVDPSWSFLSVLPLSHIFEQVVGFLIPWKVGARIASLRALKPSEIFAALAAEHPTHLLLVPRLLQLFRSRILHEASAKHLGPLLQGLLRIAPALPRTARRRLFRSIHRRFGGNLDFFVVGGAPLPIDLEQFWSALGVPLVQGYGLTETSPILACNFPDAQRLGSVGKPLPGQELRIADDGEILARGPHVFQGYDENPAKTAEAFTADGWFRTGDLGELREGWLFLKGRKKDVIVPAHGMNVYAEDVEAALLREPGVRDAAVMGLPTPEGEGIHAVLLLAPGSRPAGEIVAQANARLDPAQQIQGSTVWPEEDFPRTPTLKVRKFLVRETILQGQGKERPAVVGERRTRPPHLRMLMAQATGQPVEHVTPEKVLTSDLGLDSLGRLELVSLIESELATDLEEGDLTPKTTVADLERLVAAARLSSPPFLWRWPFHPWLMPLRAVLQQFLLALLRLVAHIEVEGRRELLGRTGSHLFVANHLSHLDTPVMLAALPAHVRRRTAVFVLAETLADAHGVRRILRSVGYVFLCLFTIPIPLPQTRGFRRALAHAGAHVDQGGSLIVFPEGARGRGGPLQPFATGVALAAREFQTPLVPFHLRGTFEILPPGRFLRLRLPRRRVRVRIGAPFTSPAGSLPEATAVIQRSVGALA